jgi:hypothetical protein
MNNDDVLNCLLVCVNWVFKCGPASREARNEKS